MHTPKHAGTKHSANLQNHHVIFPQKIKNRFGTPIPSNSDKRNADPNPPEDSNTFSLLGKDYIYFDENQNLKVAFQELSDGSPTSKKCGVESDLCLGRLFMSRFELIMKYNLEENTFNPKDKGLSANFLVSDYDFKMRSGLWMVMGVVGGAMGLICVGFGVMYYAHKRKYSLVVKERLLGGG